MPTVQLSPPAAPFSRIKNPGEKITISTAGKILVIPTGGATLLPSFNEYALNTSRLTVAESPFGGLKGSGSPDYAVGTAFVNSGDGIYLTDINGANSTKTLTAGKLKEVSSLTVDTTAKTIAEEFIISNTNLSNNSDTIDPFTGTTGWTLREGSGSLSVADGVLTVAGSTDGSKIHRIQKDFNITDSTEFLRVKIKNSQNAYFSLVIWSDAGYTKYKYWSSSRFPLTANTDAIFVLPLKAPAHTSGTDMNPDGIVEGFDNTKITRIVIGITAATNATNTITISELRSDVIKTGAVEISVPDSLADSSLQIQAHNGTSYQTIGSYKLDSVYSAVGTPTSANWRYADGTQLDSVIAGAPNGRALFPKGISGATVNGSTGTLTYSANKGTRQRIGIKVDLPPSDNGRTNFSKIRLKLVFTYANSGQTSYEFEDSTNTSYGLQNLTKPWIALYDSTKSLIDFYLFTHKPKALTRRRNDSGEVYELVLYPGNGAIYHGQITYGSLTADTGGTLVPDALKSTVQGSLTNFLAGYDFCVSPTAIEFFTTGQTFAPVLQTTGSPAILWTFSDASTDTTATPSKDFGSSALRKHTLVVTPWSGLLTINIGYNADDEGETAGEGSNLTAVTQQNVSGIRYLHLASALTKIACSRNPITYLDVSNHPTLQKIEAFNAGLTSVVLKNNTTLKRLCVEQCALTSLDLSECLNIEDLRAAYQTTGVINISWSESVYPALFHVCTRDQTNITKPPIANMPALETLFIWSTGYSGTLDLSTCSNLELVDASYNALTNVILPDDLTKISALYFIDDDFPQSVVDYVLETCDASELTWKGLVLTSNTVPSEHGLTHKANLLTKFWSVTTD